MASLAASKAAKEVGKIANVIQIQGRNKPNPEIDEKLDALLPNVIPIEYDYNNKQNNKKEPKSNKNPIHFFPLNNQRKYQYNVPRLLPNLLKQPMQQNPLNQLNDIGNKIDEVISIYLYVSIQIYIQIHITDI